MLYTAIAAPDGPVGALGTPKTTIDRLPQGGGSTAAPGAATAVSAGWRIMLSSTWWGREALAR